MDGKSSSPESDSDRKYSNSKEFSFFGQKKTIVLHSGKGSDLLLPICNALLLKGDVLEDEFLGNWELLEFLREKMESVFPAPSRRSLSLALSKTGDLEDCRPEPLWNKVDSFKKNDCFEILKVLELPIYHGWIVDDQNAEEISCEDLGAKVELSEMEKEMFESRGKETDYGLSILKETLKEQEVCVFVRDNVFHTATKHEDEIYVLITERGLNRDGFLWKKVVGGEMVGEDFQEETEVDEDIEPEAGGTEMVNDDEEEVVNDEDIEAEAGDLDAGDLEIAQQEEEAEMVNEVSTESDSSMETHAGGIHSPNSTLDDPNSSSSTSDS
ncbi:unnamed protein product [Microthlaspi erraticum]|uniref:MINDY deubiquitinase domain-containing protein n=1 Tax=Microthlaspi erraticum TaxID=1685480 RepID=A0A6D2KK96_9BRAS|nr:unnamed protein product [Microthlaspi erraticum]